MTSLDRITQLSETLPIIQPLIYKEDMGMVYVGGLPTDFLLSPGATIDLDHKIVNVEGDVTAPLFRSNGTLRDIDLVCFTDDVAVLRRLNDTIRNTLLESGRLDEIPKISISGYEKDIRSNSYLQLVSQISRKDNQTHLSLGPIHEAIEASVFEESWTILHNELALPIHHPIIHMSNYRIRSLAGLRPKDKEKINRLETKLRTSFSDMEWEKFSGFLAFEERISQDIQIREALEQRSLQKFSLAIAKIALRQFETNSFLTKHAQDETTLIHRLAKRAVHHSRNSFQL